MWCRFDVLMLLLRGREGVNGDANGFGLGGPPKPPIDGREWRNVLLLGPGDGMRDGETGDLEYGSWREDGPGNPDCGCWVGRRRRGGGEVALMRWGDGVRERTGMREAKGFEDELWLCRRDGNPVRGGGDTLVSRRRGGPGAKVPSRGSNVDLPPGVDTLCDRGRRAGAGVGGNWLGGACWNRLGMRGVGELGPKTPEFRRTSTWV